jgi:hypothetical protein
MLTISFVEAMRGWLRRPDGFELPISFEVSAVGIRPGHFEIRGLLAAPPLVREAPARGTLEMSLSLIAYHLDFTGDDGQSLHLDAAKHPSILAPLKSMTEMEARVTDDGGRVLASGEMRFATRDLPGFLASWLPGRRQARRQLDTRRRGLERRALAGGPPLVALEGGAGRARA